MLYVIISVVFSVAVSVILRLARKDGVQHLHLVVWNYPVATLATLLFLRPPMASVPIIELPWWIYVGLAFLLPTIFLCIAYAIQYSGIVRTEIAQRLSLFVPLLAAYFIFQEKMHAAKLLGITMGVLAILMSISWRKGRSGTGETWRYALAVFLGMGIIDILFKKMAVYDGVPYGFSMLMVFILSMVVAFAFLLHRIVQKGERLEIRAVLWGILLGIFNFGNILFYMKAHRALSESPSMVFTGMNIGVILLGALVGTRFFGERLTAWNKLGLVLAIISVLIIAFL